MEAALLADERRLEAEVCLLELIAYLKQVRHGVLGLGYAAPHEGGVGRPVGVVHDVVEDVVDGQGRSAFLGVQDLGVHGEWARDVHAVGGGHVVALLEHDHVGSLLGGRDGGHEAGGAQAADHEVAVDGFDGLRRGRLGSGALLGEGKPGAGGRNGGGGGGDKGTAVHRGVHENPFHMV